MYVFRFVSDTGWNWARTATDINQSSYKTYMALATKAVDGNDDGIFSNFTCTKTIYSDLYRGTFWSVFMKH